MITFYQFCLWYREKKKFLGFAAYDFIVEKVTVEPAQSNVKNQKMNKKNKKDNRM